MKFLGRLIEEYCPMAQSISAADLDNLARQNGHKKLDAFVLLRDLYNLHLTECKAVASQCEPVQKTS